MSVRVRRFFRARWIIAPILIAVTVFAGWLGLYKKYGAYWLLVLRGEVSERLLRDRLGSQETADKLMIVAHPDDDLLWGGAHLEEGGYFVLCLTCGDNGVRSGEFARMLEETGNRGAILSYPDVIGRYHADWSWLEHSMQEDLRRLITFQEWELIVTHNPDGEYGHIHHKTASRLVTAVCRKEELTARLYYFGRYYEVGQIPQGSPMLEKEKVMRKRELLTVYKSQQTILQGSFAHIVDYEDWKSYEEWNREVPLLFCGKIGKSLAIAQWKCYNGWELNGKGELG